MAFFKWFDRINFLQNADAQKPRQQLSVFDLNALRPKTLGQKVKAKAGSLLFRSIIPPILRLCQKLWPIPSIPFLDLVIVTRDADVRAVLFDNDSFGVPYGPEMRDLGDGTTFGLGLDGEGHRRQREIMQAVMAGTNGEFFQRDLDLVLKHTLACAESLVENGAGRLDVVRDYITRIATETAAKYFGLEIEDPDTFAEWSLASSSMLFGDPFGDRVVRDVALNGGARLRLAINVSLKRAKNNYRKHPCSVGRTLSIIDRLVKIQADRENTDDKIADAEIVAILLGLITGFIPTNTLAGSKMLSEILRRPDVLADMRRCAESGDRGGVRAILKEAARFDSALAPGQWRYARKDAVIADGTRRRRHVKAGTIILVSTMTALRDPRRFEQPGRFRTDRANEGDLMFGWGPHACMGSQMATEQLTTMFLTLFAQPDLQAAPGALGKIDYVGAFPVRLDMTYRHIGEAQSMFLVIVPVPVEFPLSKAELDEQLRQFGHPAAGPMRDALYSTGLVHFASLATLETERGIDIVFELSTDGKIAHALECIARTTESLLRPFYAKVGLDDEEVFSDFLQRHVVNLHSYPWGATGVNYNGTSSFPVCAIERQQCFSAHAEAILQDYLGREIGRRDHALAALNYVRRIIKGDRFHALMTDSPRYQLLNEAARKGFDTFILKPSRARLPLADFKTPSYAQAFLSFLKSRQSAPLWLMIGTVWLTLAITLWTLIPTPDLLQCRIPDMADFMRSIGQSCIWNSTALIPSLWGWATIFAGSTLGAIALLGVGVLGFVLRLRRAEKADPQDARQADIAHLQAIAKTEDHPGIAQNHIMAVGQLKPGLFRTLVHAFALWTIKMIIIFYYRPGFVVSMGTIHYARWWRLPGTRTSIFYSNYDGSWESYLEDFITRARWGQTAAWSNWLGFPEAKFLIFKGAEDGDRFKRWVRLQQKPVPFWYVRFPTLTTDQIRNNALIHHGLSRAQTESEAREWLRCFGSMPRIANRMETHEVQSIVFRGFRNLHHSASLILKLPATAEGALGSWLRWISGVDRFVDERSRAWPLLADMPEGFEGILSSKSVRLRQSLCIAFGDHQIVGEEQPILQPLVEGNKLEFSQKDTRASPMRRAVFFGSAATGLQKMVQTDWASRANLGDDLPGNFPPAFQMGMASRPNSLGDHGVNTPKDWRWSDTPDNVSGEAGEAVLLLYAESEEDIQAIKRFHTKLLEAYGGKLAYALDCAPNEKGLDYEHFGFRDGISQPVIRGTERFAKGVPDRDIVEPGEVVLGYDNNQGFLPPSPFIREEADLEGDLPVSSVEELGRFPDFGKHAIRNKPRDFGRNGTYLVLREIEQHVDKFDNFATQKARELLYADPDASGDQPPYPELFREIGQSPDAEWIKAKIVGRWKDGRPLVGNPRQHETRDVAGEDHRRSDEHAARDNDFTYGINDPQGYACPFGAHIRRANPRDSKEPGDVDEQIITNRHRLLRRGRSYQIGAEKGLLFAALCADIERQFEFVQQTWISSPSFHGLTNEPDPLLGVEKGDSRYLTIPTPAGSVKLTGIEQFTTVRGGGYFFLPSRSAVRFLAAIA